VEGPAGDYRVRVETDGPVRLGTGRTADGELRAKQRNRLAVPLTASAAGIANIKVRIAGPANFALDRNYVLAAKPQRRC